MTLEWGSTLVCSVRFPSLLNTPLFANNFTCFNISQFTDPKNTHTHTHNGPFYGTTQVSRYQKGKPIWILLKQETVSSSGISWAICKTAPRSRQTTMPAPPHPAQFFTGRMPLLSPNQQRQSTEGIFTDPQNKKNFVSNNLAIRK